MAFDANWIWPIAAAPVVGALLTLIVAGVPVLRSQPAASVRRPWPTIGDDEAGDEIGLHAAAYSVAAGIVAAWAATATGGWLAWLSCGFGWLLLSLAIIDLRYFLLPNFLTAPLFVLGFAVTWVAMPEAVLSHVIGAVGGFGFFAIGSELYFRLRGREGLGLGDAKLMAGLGAWLGWEALPGIVLVAAGIGLMAAGCHLLRGGKLQSDLRLPFGACLALGGWIAWLHGPLVIG